MLKQESKQLIINRIIYFENSDFDILDLSEDNHFLSELTMFLMVMETEGINSDNTYPDLYIKIKKFVRNYLSVINHDEQG